MKDPLELVACEETTIPVMVRSLVHRFYRQNIIAKSEYILSPFRRRGLNPITLVYNPLGFKHSRFLDSDVIVGVYPHNYFVKIEVGSSINGPHAVFLCFQADRGDHVPLATAQIEGSFYSMKVVRKALRLLIAKKGYFATEKSLDKVVQIPRNQCYPRMIEDNA